MFYRDKLYNAYGWISNEIGTGTYAKVYMSTDGYAIKVYPKMDVDFLIEVNILRGCNHPNVVKPIGLTRVKNEYWLYMYCAIGTLETVDVQKPACWYIYQILRALDYCHSNGIIHRDVKESNILVYENNHIQLADFGISRTQFCIGESHTGNVCSLWWRAPEILLGDKQYDYGIDIWSVGIILLDFLSPEHTTMGETADEQVLEIFRLLGTPNEIVWPGVTKLKRWPTCVQNFPGKTFNLDPVSHSMLKKLLAWKPHRVSAAKAMKHTFFQSVRDEINILFPHTKIPERDEFEVGVSILPPKTRAIVLEWLWEVEGLYKLGFNTLFTSYAIFDHWVTTRRTHDMFQLHVYALTCLYIADSIEGCAALTFDIMEQLIGGLYNAYDLERMVHDVLTNIQFKIPEECVYKGIAKIAPQKLSDNFYTYVVGVYLNYTLYTLFDHYDYYTIVTEYLSGMELTDHYNCINKEGFERMLKMSPELLGEYFCKTPVCRNIFFGTDNDASSN